MAKGIQSSIGSVITIGAFILIGVILIKVLKPLGIVDDVKGLFTDALAEGSKAFDDKARETDLAERVEETATETQQEVQAQGEKTRDVVKESENIITKEVKTGTTRILTDAERKAIADRQRDAIIHAQNKFLVKEAKEDNRNVVVTPAAQTSSRTVVIGNETAARAELERRKAAEELARRTIEIGNETAARAQLERTRASVAAKQAADDAAKRQQIEAIRAARGTAAAEQARLERERQAAAQRVLQNQQLGLIPLTTRTILQGGQLRTVTEIARGTGGILRRPHR